MKIDNECLYVSDYAKEIVISFGDVVNITDNRWHQGPLIFIHLKESTEFGDKIAFLPSVTTYFWSRHPIIAELKDLARLAVDASPADP